MILSSGQTNFQYKITRTIFAWLVFVCLSASFVPVFGQQKHHADDEVVFCPLQKIWVKKNFVALPKTVKPLDGVCAADELKEFFLVESSRNLFSLKFFSSTDGAEKIFFAYAAKGKQALAEIAAPSDGSPERRIAKLAAREKSVGGDFKNDFQQAMSATISLENFPRPPTFFCPIESDFQFAHELKKISRSINPRSPPVFV